MTNFGAVAANTSVESLLAAGFASIVKAANTARGTDTATLDDELFLTLAVGSYSFQAELPVTTGGATEGIKVTVAGTATASAVVAEVEIHSHAATPVVTNGRVTSIAGTAIGQTVAGAGGATVHVMGTITVSGAGTFGISWAQNAHVATNTSVLIGSWLIAWPTAVSVSSGVAMRVEHGYALSDETTALTTGTAKLTVRAPSAFTLTSVRASLATTSSSGTPTVDINLTGTGTILSTKLTIDQGEKTSTTAAVAAVISTSAIPDDAELTFDIDVAGTGAAGLKVYLIGTRS